MNILMVLSGSIYLKKQDFKNFSDGDIKLFQSKINRSPRKLLNFESPKDSFYKKVALVT
jgi:IS30 family transposase